MPLALSEPTPSHAVVQAVADAVDDAPAEHVGERLAADGDGHRGAVDLDQHVVGRVGLCEGGPALLGGLIGAEVVDELFLTIAPQIAGRSNDHPRPSLVEGLGFEIGAAPWAELVSVMRSTDHLFLRYRITARRRPRGPT